MSMTYLSDLKLLVVECVGDFGGRGKTMLPSKQSEERGKGSPTGLTVRKRDLGWTCPKGPSS